MSKESFIDDLSKMYDLYANPIDSNEKNLSEILRKIKQERRKLMFGESPKQALVELLREHATMKKSHVTIKMQCKIGSAGAIDMLLAELISEGKIKAERIKNKTCYKFIHD